MNRQPIARLRDQSAVPCSVSNEGANGLVSEAPEHSWGFVSLDTSAHPSDSFLVHGVACCLQTLYLVAQVELPSLLAKSCLATYSAQHLLRRSSIVRRYIKMLAFKQTNVAARSPCPRSITRSGLFKSRSSSRRSMQVKVCA
jgi:hypothetical protein